MNFKVGKFFGKQPVYIVLIRNNTFKKAKNPYIKVKGKNINIKTV